MAELRKVRFGNEYWHVVNDDPDDKQIIGSLLFVPESVLPWRAEFSPSRGAPEDLAIGYFQNEQQAMTFLEQHVKGEA